MVAIPQFSISLFAILHPWYSKRQVFGPSYLRLLPKGFETAIFGHGFATANTSDMGILWTPREVPQAVYDDTLGLVYNRNKPCRRMSYNEVRADLTAYLYEDEKYLPR